MPVQRSVYIHQKADWPQLCWDTDELLSLLTDVHFEQGRLLEKLDRWTASWQQQAQLQILETEVVQSSAVEGEHLPPAEVRSSLARRLGLEIAGLPHPDAKVEGVVDMMMAAIRSFDQPLRKEDLFSWHGALFPTGRSGLYTIAVAQWRTNLPSDPMQVISGAAGKEKVHFEAPPSAGLEAEMQQFLDWFNTEKRLNSFLKAGIAHLWFLTLHPFDDGNGRMARALTERLLCSADKKPLRFYSMSAQIKKQRKGYYEVLEKTQQGTLDITLWLKWFLGCLHQSILDSHEQLTTLVRVAAFWDRHRQTVLSERQLKVIKRMCHDFAGTMNSSKYGSLARCSSDTALRDLQDLVSKDVLTKTAGGGRSTAYSILWP